MAVDAEAVNDVVRKYVADVKKAIPVDHAFLFGSHARGAATEHSDIDLCFFSKNFENLSMFAITKFLFRLARKYQEFDLEPMGFPTSDLENDNPFVKEIVRTGIEV